MATFTAIKNKAQSTGSMRGVLDYISQKEKTMLENRQLVSGHNCMPRCAYDEMMVTKRQPATGCFISLSSPSAQRKR